LGKGATDADAASLVQQLSDSHILSIASNDRVQYVDLDEPAAAI